MLSEVGPPRGRSSGPIPLFVALFYLFPTSTQLGRAREKPNTPRGSGRRGDRLVPVAHISQRNPAPDGAFDGDTAKKKTQQCDVQDTVEGRQAIVEKRKRCTRPPLHTLPPEERQRMVPSYRDDRPTRKKGIVRLDEYGVQMPLLVPSK